jgi:predicted RNA-binding Zn ribbon-like protein
MAVTFPDGTHHDGYSAPADLEPLRPFVNTLDVDEGTDALSSPQVLVTWLREHGLLTDADDGDSSSATAEDLEAAVALRGALRAMLLCNHDGTRPDPAAIRVLNETSDRACMSVRFTDDGWSVCACGVPGIAGAFGRLLTIIADAQKDGTWQRLKICAADDCAWAYYDVSRNRSRRWCSMEVCGNRAKVHAYRGRAAEG